MSLSLLGFNCAHTTHAPVLDSIPSDGFVKYSQLECQQRFFFYLVFPFVTARCSRLVEGSFITNAFQLNCIGLVIAASLFFTIFVVTENYRVSNWCVYMFPPIRIIDFILGVMAARQKTRAFQKCFTQAESGAGFFKKVCLLWVCTLIFPSLGHCFFLNIIQSWLVICCAGDISKLTETLFATSDVHNSFFSIQFNSNSFAKKFNSIQFNSSSFLKVCNSIQFNSSRKSIQFNSIHLTVFSTCNGNGV